MCNLAHPALARTHRITLLLLTLLHATNCIGQSTGTRNNPSAGGANTITLVGTGEELEAAIERGDTHIEIIEHMDLTSFPARPDSFNHEVFWPKPSTRSIRVRHDCMHVRAHACNCQT